MPNHLLTFELNKDSDELFIHAAWLDCGFWVQYYLAWPHTSRQADWSMII